MQRDRDFSKLAVLFRRDEDDVVTSTQLQLANKVKFS
jgi:hypothetical protein